ncbi:hypothetical protein LIER_16435 [Lithospermum erythrorhizon]|uniref:Uncharacterized protein n=1 Tax=Lithospermum erythrorhizon TaxID=34254 RepID=A0AAV3QAS4_LITER
MIMCLSPIVADTSKTRNPSSDFIERVGSIETLISPVEGSKRIEKHVDREVDDVGVGTQHSGVSVEEVNVPEKVSENVEGVNPSVNDTSNETSYKSAKTHSSMDPTVPKILAGMKGTKAGGVKRGRIKRNLRKQGILVRHVKRDSPAMNPTVEEAAVDSPGENQDDDDVVVVFYTTSRNRRRTKTSVVAGGVDIEVVEKPYEAVDVEELKRLAEKKKATKKDKGKVKRPSVDKAGEPVPKKRKGVFRGDRFIPDDVADVSEEEDMAEILRKRSKSKLKIDDNRNKVNNRRNAKDVLDLKTEGVDFNSEEHEARWKLLVVMANIGPHWQKMVRKFVCCISVDVADPDSPIFHKVKLRGHIFKFSPALINKHYRSSNDGITGATLNLADIIGELTREALIAWPTKGQLQGFSLSLRYVVSHNIGDHSRTGAKLKPNSFPILICSQLVNQHPKVLKAEDVFGEDAKSVTIKNKLMTGKYVIDVPLRDA